MNPLYGTQNFIETKVVATAKCKKKKPVGK